MKRLLKNKKALSPVVAAIILIAVTVAVSIAVAAWMGSLTIGLMETPEVGISDVRFRSTGIYVDLVNTGTSDANIASAKVNGNSAAISGTLPVQLTASGGTATDVQLDALFNQGQKYQISVFGSDGTLLASYTATANMTRTS